MRRLNSAQRSPTQQSRDVSLALQLQKGALEGANNPTTTKSPLQGGLEMEAGKEKELGRMLGTP